MKCRDRDVQLLKQNIKRCCNRIGSRVHGAIWLCDNCNVPTESDRLGYASRHHVARRTAPGASRIIRCRLGSNDCLPGR